MTPKKEPNVQAAMGRATQGDIKTYKMEINYPETLKEREATIAQLKKDNQTLTRHIWKIEKTREIPAAELRGLIEAVSFLFQYVSAKDKSFQELESAVNKYLNETEWPS